MFVFLRLTKGPDSSRGWNGHANCLLPASPTRHLRDWTCQGVAGRHPYLPISDQSCAIIFSWYIHSGLVLNQHEIARGAHARHRIWKDTLPLHLRHYGSTLVVLQLSIPMAQLRVGRPISLEAHCGWAICWANCAKLDSMEAGGAIGPVCLLCSPSMTSQKWFCKIWRIRPRVCALLCILMSLTWNFLHLVVVLDSSFTGN